jgi:CRP-like cAMP-binding protein
MNKLHNFLQQLQLPEEVYTLLLQCWNIEKTLSKGDFLIREGEVEYHLHLVLQGELLIYYERDGLEQTVGFGYEDTLICSFPSFIRLQPSDYYIRALSETILIGISRQDFYSLLHQYNALETVWRSMVEVALLGRIEREVDLLTVSPKERIQRLLNRSPHLFQLVPLKYIASYLHMAPETLSRNMK